MAISPTGTLTPFKQKLIELVEAEQQFFKGHTETEDKFSERVGVFWKQGVGLSLTGKDVDQPWSAAFVSWAMKTAGAGANFPYSDHHGHYILAAIKNRQAGQLDAPIVGFRVSERAPRPGDLIGQGRATSTSITYDEAAQEEHYPSHVDVVVDVGNGTLSTIGGNVSNSVTRRTVPLDANGLLAQPQGHWFVVIAVNL